MRFKIDNIHRLIFMILNYIEILNFETILFINIYIREIITTLFVMPRKRKEAENNVLNTLTKGHDNLCTKSIY